MKLNQLFLLSIVSILSLIVASCKSTVEGETSRWDSNSQKIVQLKQQYPQFSNAIEQQFEIARKQWVNAQAISGEEQKISAMSVANSRINNSFIDLLSDMDNQKRKLRDLQDKLRRLNGPEELSYRASSSTSECTYTLSIIDMTLARGAQTNSEAESVLQALKQSIENTILHGNDVVAYADELERKKVQEEKDKQTTTTNSNASSTTTESTVTETPAATNSVTCSYCGTTNASGGGNCSSCKAPL